MNEISDNSRAEKSEASEPIAETEGADSLSPTQSDRVANFFYELGILQVMKRSGQDYLGSGNQSVADHSFRVTMMGYTLASMAGADVDKVLKMCLFHDLEEARTGDLNYLQQAYVESDDDKALKESLEGLPIEKDVHSIIDEYKAQKTLESQLARDADVLELLFFLKEQKDRGNQQADNWLRNAVKRLKTDLAKKIFDSASEKMYYEWWYNRKDESWKHGNKNW